MAGGFSGSFCNPACSLGKEGVLLLSQVGDSPEGISLVLGIWFLRSQSVGPFPSQFPREHMSLGTSSSLGSWPQGPGPLKVLGSRGK